MYGACGQMSYLTFVQGLLTGVRGNCFSWKARWRDWDKLTPKQGCWKAPDFNTNTGYFGL